MNIKKIFIFSVFLMSGIQNNFLMEAKASPYISETESESTANCFDTSELDSITYKSQKLSETRPTLYPVYWPGHPWYHRREIRPWIDPLWEPAIEPGCVEICHPWGCHYKCD